MKALAQKIFGTNGEWQIVDKKNKVVSSYDKLNKAEKNMAINLCCSGKYSESQIVFMMFRDDFSDGFAFTIDAFCTGGTSGGNIIEYKEISRAEDILHANTIFYGKNNNTRNSFLGALSGNKVEFRRGILANDKLFANVKKFLEVVKNL